MKLGILDWGIGGVGFYAMARARRPDLSIVYWSDAGTVPYGKQTPPELARRLVTVARWLKREAGVTHLAIACNAASSVLPAIDLEDETLPEMTGVIEHGVRAALQRSAPGQLIGVVGGRRTILSGAYRRALFGRTVRQRVAQPISARVEAGDLSSDGLRGELDRIMAPLRAVDLLVLACTHYAALRAAFAARTPRAEIVDPAAELLAWAVDRWQLESAASDGASDRVFTTGDAQATAQAARAAFGFPLDPVSISL
jgi:glutamate racemase